MSPEPAPTSRASTLLAGNRALLAVAYLLFFASGFAALLYQVIWQRMLAIFSGIDVFAVTIIVAAFMAGLGCGTMVGGYLADALSSRRRLLLFAAAEMAVALFALASKWLYYDVLYERFAALSGTPYVLAPILFVSLLWPTFFMGMSLPLLSRALVAGVEVASIRVGALYGLNTLGAAVGALATTWVLIRAVGFETCIHLGAATNFAVAVGALALIPGLGSEPRAQRVEPDVETAPASSHRLPFLAWALLYGTSGFVALALEILWFRLLGVLIKSTAFTFGTLLAIFLTCSALGTLAALPWSRRVQRPGVYFFAFQASITLYAGLALGGLVRALETRTGLEGLWRYLGGYEPLDVGATIEALADGAMGPLIDDFLFLYFGLPFVLMGPATFLMGLSFPFLQRVVQTDVAFVGRRVGWLQTANIVGSMLGSICVGWLLLDWLGTAHSFRLLLALGGVYLAFWLREWVPAGAGRWVAIPLAAGVVLGVARVAPGQASLWATLHGTTPGRMVFAEDNSGVSVVKPKGTGPSKRFGVFVNGRGQSSIPFGGTHTLLGIAPVLLHPDPKHVAVIGLGSGDTVFSMGGRPETEEITCYEIIGQQLETLARANEKLEYAGLRWLSEDKRLRFHFTDGRSAITRGEAKYDLIEADALRPNSAYSGVLYSYEYYRSLREHLKPGGMAVSWAPTPRVGRTFVRAFPYVVQIGEIFIGSNEPIAVDPEAVRARARNPDTVSFYRKAGINVTGLAEGMLARVTLHQARDFPEGSLRDINSDLFPKDEYLVPQ